MDYYRVKLTQKMINLRRIARERDKKKWQTEHRTATTAYPCYLPILGEFSRSWSCRFAGAKLTKRTSIRANNQSNPDK